MDDSPWKDGPVIPLYKYVLNPSSLILSEPDFYLLVVVEGVGHDLNIFQSYFKIDLCQVASLGKCFSHQAGPPGWGKSRGVGVRGSSGDVIATEPQKWKGTQYFPPFSK